MKAIVDYKTLQSGEIIAVCENRQATEYPAHALENYMNKIKEITGGDKVEFNNTLRASVGGGVFYTFQRIPLANKIAIVPKVFEVIVLDNTTLAMNDGGVIEIIHPEDGDQVFATKAEAEQAAKAHALYLANTHLDNMCEERHQLKDKVKNLSELIDKMVAFKRSLNA